MEKHFLARNPMFFRVIFFIFLLAVPLQRASAQITFSVKGGKLGTVIEQIKKQSGYQFFYSDNLSSEEVNSVNVTDASVENIMDKLFDGRNISYRVVGKIIYLSRRPVRQSGEGPLRKISGRVTDEKNEPLAGVSVVIKGTQTGVYTDQNGYYVISTTKDDPVMEFVYMGYKTVSVRNNKKTVINVYMQDNAEELNEVVVTALGIKRSQKALSYNVQQIKDNEITGNTDANFVNSLSGKVAGVVINSSSSGIGGASKVVMRGAKAIAQSSNALYVIDGVPMFNFSYDGGTEYDSRGTSEGIADINPEDIESISVLTGAAAAALYGSEAANGAIVITTKKGHAGRTELTFTQNTDFLSPFVMPEFQNRYGTGSGISDVAVLDKSWGKNLNNYNYMGYSPEKDFMKTGVVTTETFSLSTGSDKNQTYISAGAVNSQGLVPNNDYDRYNFTFRNTTSFLKDRFTLDIGGSYIVQNDLNMVNQGTYSNPLVTAYLFPRGDDWNDIRMYERYDSSRKIYTQYWPQEINEFTGQNPYWISYRNLRSNKKDRYMMNANIKYKIADWLNISGRIRLDNSQNKYEKKLYATSNKTLTEGSDNGYYEVSNTNNKQTYGDLLVNIDKTFENKISIQANVGASISDVRQDLLGVRGPIREDLFSNEFNVFQLDNSKTKRTQSGFHDQTKSLLASAVIGYDSVYYLTLTGRNDWPSQLAGPNSKQKSFFYPSAGVSVILSELFDMPEQISYLKIRGSFASVGLPFARFLANPTYEWDSSLQSWKTKSNYPMYNLKPERTDSWEFGFTAHFLDHFNLDVTLYNTKTYNQTFNPQISVSSKYSSLYVQTGSVRNRGIELALGYTNTWGDFKWSTDYTFSADKNKILELVRDYVHPETGAIINKDRLDVGGFSEAHFILKEGGTLGDLYSLSDLQRDSEGRIYIDKDGSISQDNSVDEIKLGSVFPKSNMAWKNDLSYKNFSCDFMLAARFGGIVYSATQAALDLYGVSEASAAARDKGYVLLNGNDHVDPEVWYTTVGSKGGIPQYYTYSATNIRLQEARIGYTFKKSVLWNIADITVSLVGRNLWMIYNKAPFDPESVATTGNYYQGIDNFMIPNTRNIGFNIRIKF